MTEHENINKTSQLRQTAVVRCLYNTKKIKIMKLISMTDFVLEQFEEEISCAVSEQKMYDYANFLKQPLTLAMFVPCDDYGNVLEIPTKENSNNTIDHDSKLMDYNDAKSKVLFNGFSYINEVLINNKNHCSINKYDLNKLSIESLIVFDLDCTVSF